jgi:sensor histidine kinase YesM
MKTNGQAETLQESVGAIVNQPVATARHNSNQAFKQIEDILFALPIHVHQAILQQLGASVEVRKIEAQNAISEMQHQQRQKQEAEANKPKLAGVQ